ncbi:MAG: hypothetical protein GF364_08075 [Candidatus Lokiarchaeota archaeon]|nr:hypothetical protein [Candidatus Lokiarchaeota archaeon]
MSKKVKMAIIILIGIFMVYSICNFVFGIVESASDDDDHKVKVELKSYSVVWNTSDSQYELGMQFWNSHHTEQEVFLHIFAVDPFAASPSHFSLTSFDPYEIKACSSNISAPSGSKGSLTLSIMGISGAKIYARSYNIVLEPGNTVENPDFVNETVYVDVNIDLDIEIIHTYPDPSLKLLLIAAAIFTASALYVKSQTEVYQANGSEDSRELEKEKVKLNRKLKGSFYSLAAGVVGYYVTSEQMQFGGLFADFNYGFEIAALLCGGAVFSLVKLLFSSEKREAFKWLFLTSGFSGTILSAIDYVSYSIYVIILLLLCVISIILFFTAQKFPIVTQYFQNLNKMKQARKEEFIKHGGEI